MLRQRIRLHARAGAERSERFLRHSLPSPRWRTRSQMCSTSLSVWLEEKNRVSRRSELAQMRARWSCLSGSSERVGSSSTSSCGRCAAQDEPSSAASARHGANFHIQIELEALGESVPVLRHVASARGTKRRSAEGPFNHG